MAGLILVSGVAFKVEKAALTAIKDIDLDACLFVCWGRLFRCNGGLQQCKRRSLHAKYTKGYYYC